MGGVGWVLRHWNGTPLMVGFRAINQQWEVKWLEVVAICEGLCKIPNDSPKVIVESDAYQVVRLLSSNEQDLTELSLLINEAHALMRMKNI